MAYFANVGRGYYGLYGAFLLAVGAWPSVDHALNYRRTAARVESADLRCRPVGTDDAERKALARDRLWSNHRWGDCDEARVYAEGKKSVTVSGRVVAHIRYVSPADGQEHDGIVAVTGEAARKVREGGELAVYAHSRKPLVVAPAEGS